jgi:hypothetical protein
MVPLTYGVRSSRTVHASNMDCARAAFQCRFPAFSCVAWPRFAAEGTQLGWSHAPRQATAIMWCHMRSCCAVWGMPSVRSKQLHCAWVLVLVRTMLGTPNRLKEFVAGTPVGALHNPHDAHCLTSLSCLFCLHCHARCKSETNRRNIENKEHTALLLY